MMPRAPETEALDEGTVPPDSTALPRSLLGHIAREVGWGEAHDATGSKPVDQEAKQHKQINTSDNQQLSGTSGSPPARVGKFGATCSC
jgi:hypothetical protein